MKLLRRILLTMIGLAGLVVAEQAFGMTAAVVFAGIGFLGYVFWLTLRQMAEEEDDEI